MNDTTTTAPRWFVPATWLEGIYGPRAHAKANGAEAYLCGSPLPMYHDWLTDELAAVLTPIRCGTCKRMADTLADTVGLTVGLSHQPDADPRPGASSV